MIGLSDGNIILSGSSSSNISGNKTENNKGDSDYWIVKIDTDGNIIWDKTIGGESFDVTPYIVKDENNNLYIAGSSISNASGDKTEDIRGGGAKDVWVVKIDPDGNIIWDKAIGSKGYDEIKNIFYHNNHLYLGVFSDGHAGYDKSEDCYSISGNNGYGFDYWIVKLDVDGNIIWDKTIGGYKGEKIGNILSINNDELLLTGRSSSNISGNKTENSIGGADYWLVKIDVDGNIIWDKTIGGHDMEFTCQGVSANPSEVVIAGSSKSGSGGGKTDVCRGETDFWMLKLDIATGLENLSNQADISVYPNPAKESIVLQGLNHVQNISIFNSQGQWLKQINHYQPNKPIDISDLPKGMYFLRIGTRSFKFVK